MLPTGLSPADVRGMHEHAHTASMRGWPMGSEDTDPAAIGINEVAVKDISRGQDGEGGFSDGAVGEGPTVERLSDRESQVALRLGGAEAEPECGTCDRSEEERGNTGGCYAGTGQRHRQSRRRASSAIRFCDAISQAW